MKKWYLNIVFLFMLLNSQAQDIHYSQFYASPLTINPANTGLFYGSYRVGVNAKRQWASIPVPYQTASFYGDWSFKREDMFSVGKWSAGLQVFNDVAGDGNLSSTRIFLSGAVHQYLDYDHTKLLSAGLQLGYIQRSIDFTKLYWGNQWDGTQFNTQINNKESFKRSTFSYLDAAVGLDYQQVIKERHNAHIGFSIQHLARPSETFYDNDNQVGLRPVAYLDTRFKIQQRHEIWSAAFFQRQKKAQEILMSCLYGYNIAEEYAYDRYFFWIGASYRWKDAFTPVLGFEWNRIRLLFNYDINISSLKVASLARGGLELSLVYIGSLPTKSHRRPMVVPCPIF